MTSINQRGRHLNQVALEMAKNGVPNKTGISKYSLKSKTMKLTVRMNCLTFTNTSIRTPLGCTKDLLANCKVAKVSRNSPNLSDSR